MSQVKKQHYVPQFYLRRFANPKSQIHVYDKFGQKSFRANIRDIASARYFYNLSQEYISELENSVRKIQSEEKFEQELVDEILKRITDVQMIENRLSRLEDHFATVLDNVIDGLEKRKRFEKNLRGDFAVFVAVQFWRTYERRQGMMELEQKLEERMMEIVRKIDEVKGTDTTAQDLGIAYHPEGTAHRHKMLLFDTSLLLKTASILDNHIWMIGVNDTNEPLYTSDHPVSIHAHKTDGWQSNTGIASPGVEIMFPLSPRYTLTMVERHYFNRLVKYDGNLIDLNRDNVIYENSHQVYSSYRQVYSPSSNFELVKEMCRELPELKNPHSRWD